jgi:uncharacterized protein (UPF0333 family)
MSLNKLFIVFGIILVIFAGVVFYQFRSNSNTRTGGAAQSTNKNATARINRRYAGGTAKRIIRERFASARSGYAFCF